MYRRLSLNFCERYLYHASLSSSVRSNIKKLSNLTGDEEKRNIKTVSIKFPDYKVIYIFPFIKHVCAINVIKHRFTIFAGVAIPVIVGFHLASILPFNITITSITTGILITIWLHSLGIVCNNFVGYIYFKLDEQKVILSYIDYWGKRIDLKTSINEICSMSDNPISFTDPLYRKIMFVSQKEILKINVKLGRIIDVENFRCILGTV